mgnify:CR=1 FL=1
MKLHKIKTILAVAAMGVLSQSCLDLDPKDQLAESNLWSSPSDFQLFANQFYGWTRDFGSLDNNSVKPLHSDYNSDLFTSRDDRNRFSNGSNSVQESDGNYGSCYAHIRRTNLLLQNAEKYSASADIAQYVGEAHFFRAYSYFDLLEAEKCLQNDPIQNVVPYMIRTSTSAGDVVDKAAKDEMDKYVARVNLYSVKAMLARAYQSRGEYVAAVSKAKKVIDGGKFRLLEATSIDQSENMVDLLFSDEHIFSLRNKELSTYTKSIFKETSGGTTALRMEGSYNLYDGNQDDFRYSKWYVDFDFIKYVPDSNSIFTTKVPLIKLSEMYLLIAECTYDTDPDEARRYVNMLRRHRIRGNQEGAGDWMYLSREDIFKEMRREYIGEGQMWFAHKRNRLNLSGGLTGTIEASDDIFVFPLPDAEIESGNRNER